MELKAIVLILCLAVPWNLCNPVTEERDYESQPLIIKDDEIQNSTFLNPKKNGASSVENTELSLETVNGGDETLFLASEINVTSTTKIQKSALDKKQKGSWNPKGNTNLKQDIIQLDSSVEQEEKRLKLAAEDSKDDSENWIAPLYIRRTFPYVIAGFDENSRPIYMVQVGKMDLRSVVDRGEEARGAALKYIVQSADAVEPYLEGLRTEDGKSVGKCLLLLDFEGLTLRQMTTQNIAFLLKLSSNLRDFVERRVSECYAINVNFVAAQLTQLVRPVFGKTLERFTFLGTNPRKWKPIIRRTFGPQNLPEYYGGDSNWKPVKYFGAR